ncbi:DUF2304 domain-containing protein [Lacibacter luteus]|uniref:DUF2304 domain-containing protein n=1 Tax=Lacibacter luteus TaxID=2508719 RepID=A0A4Q1CJZ5_9BACT|nr:DUF2304 domain-containing protein [Lacibacter luteus]RXK60698.1 DUF2304 domain-containing protein [Lacibacter luteus]
MTGIQLILISGFLLALLFFFIRWRNNIADVLLFTVLSSTAIIFILYPEWTNVIAHKLGVGRGADLVFYLCILIFSFVILKLYARIRKLEQMLTDLVRKESLHKKQADQQST